VEGGKEMTDTIVAVIVGGILTVVGGITGAIIQAHFSAKESKRQMAARKEEQLAQFKHDLEVTQISRRIDLQSAYLKPLQEKISECYKLHLNLEDTLRSIKTWYGDQPEPNKNAFLMERIPDYRYPNLIKQFEETYDHLQIVHKDMNLLMSKCSDLKVNFLVQDFIFMTIIDLPPVVNSLKSSAGLVWVLDDYKINDKPFSIQTIENQLSEARKRMSETHADIEQILSGARGTIG
jgi:hypothetical protein